MPLIAILNRGTAPVEFLPDGGKKGAVAQMQQFGRAPAAPDGDGIVGAQRGLKLAVGGDDGFQFPAEQFHPDGEFESIDDRTIGDGMRAEWA